MAHTESNITSTSESETESSDGAVLDRRCGAKRYVKRRTKGGAAGPYDPKIKALPKLG